ncbi:MAG TPA: hypothetical protein VMU80_21960 [Bryobacteraceae bacterium]|nr:hypothetical protein [Bryobacteraceae bacterium]
MSNMRSRGSCMAQIKGLMGLAALSIAPAFASPITVDVNSTDMPWLYSDSLNSAYQYGTYDGTDPLSVSAASGLSFTPGDILTVTWQSGSACMGYAFSEPIYCGTDALGDTQYIVNNSPGTSGKVMPSYYMDPATYPIYLGELVGVFADSSGDIVGTPFAIGNSLSFAIPSGTTQLLLGVNDDIYSDNQGSYTISISETGGSSVPEPATSGEMLAGILLISVPLLRRRKTCR